jgi:hypothetical protein
MKRRKRNNAKSNSFWGGNLIAVLNQMTKEISGCLDYYKEY